jgi:hypothetical protein
VAHAAQNLFMMISYSKAIIFLNCSSQAKLNLQVITQSGHTMRKEVEEKISINCLNGGNFILKYMIQWINAATKILQVANQSKESCSIIYNSLLLHFYVILFEAAPCKPHL